MQADEIQTVKKEKRGGRMLRKVLQRAWRERRKGREGRPEPGRGYC